MSRTLPVADKASQPHLHELPRREVLPLPHSSRCSRTETPTLPGSREAGRSGGGFVNTKRIHIRAPKEELATA